MPWYDWLRNLWRVSREPRLEGPGAATRAATGATDEDHPAAPSLALTAGAFALRVGVETTRGNVRDSNEDNYFVPGHPGPREPGARRDNGRTQPDAAAPAAAPDEPRGLFLVADGMGGQLAGEKASEMAVAIIPEQLRRRLTAADDEKAVKRAIREAVAAANQEVLAQSRLNLEFANMGTTIVLALFHRDRVFVAGVGDSRGYRLRGDRLEQLTRDHSLAMALVEANTIRPEEAESHRFRNVLYLYIGCKDAREGPEEIRVLELVRGDRFLLATDGLTGVVRDEVIGQVLATCDDPQRAAQALVNRALENRSKDNITCVVIHVA